MWKPHEKKTNRLCRHYATAAAADAYMNANAFELRAEFDCIINEPTHDEFFSNGHEHTRRQNIKNN